MGVAGRDRLDESVVGALGTRVSDKRMLPMVAPERRFWAVPLAPPPLPFLPSACRAAFAPSLLWELPLGRQQQTV